MEAAILTAPRESSGVHADARAGKYLTFHLGREEFAIQVLKVREIMGVQDITALPQTSPHVKGVVNLGGNVVPVVDVRPQVRPAELEYTERTCVIVVQVRLDTAVTQMGILVDAVPEVLDRAAHYIKNTPEFGSGVVTRYLLGMAKSKGKVKILLGIDQALSSQELQGITDGIS
jgi:purine-binding chemotaxis protein CheW